MSRGINAFLIFGAWSGFVSFASWGTGLLYPYLIDATVRHEVSFSQNPNAWIYWLIIVGCYSLAAGAVVLAFWLQKVRRRI